MSQSSVPFCRHIIGWFGQHIKHIPNNSGSHHWQAWSCSTNGWAEISHLVNSLPGGTWRNPDTVQLHQQQSFSQQENVTMTGIEEHRTGLCLENKVSGIQFPNSAHAIFVSLLTPCGGERYPGETKLCWSWSNCWMWVSAVMVLLHGKKS